jgi:hypothetical protein
LIGRQNGLFASVNAGKIILIFILVLLVAGINLLPAGESIHESRSQSPPESYQRVSVAHTMLKELSHTEQDAQQRPGKTLNFACHLAGGIVLK